MVAILALLGISVAALAIVTSLISVSLTELKMSGSGGAIDQTFYAAESGINEALALLAQDTPMSSQHLNINNNLVEIEIMPNPADPFQRIITSTAVHPTGKIRKLQVIADTDDWAAGFDYAVQGGVGGVILENNSDIYGDIYSNGAIKNTSAANSVCNNNCSVITGNVWTADPQGIRRINVAKDAGAEGNIYAHQILLSRIAGDAEYQNIDSKSVVEGISTIVSTDPPPKPFPIDSNDIQVWKDNISDSGNTTITPNAAGCDAAHNVGFYCLPAGETRTIGNQVIDGGLYMDIGSSLILTGNVWIKGNIDLRNNGNISIDPSLGNGSAVMISDGNITVLNNLTISGTGNEKSFILMISTSSSIDPPAILGSNNSESIVFVAIDGRLRVENGASLNAVLAKEIYLEENSEINYNPDLMLFMIPINDQQPIDTSADSWKEL